MLENASDLKAYTIVKTVGPGATSEANITKSFKPRNYTVPMDFDGDQLAYVFKKVKKSVPEEGPEFGLYILDLSTVTPIEVSGFTNNLHMLRLFRDGFVYVKNNKNVHYYDLKTHTDSFLYNHQLTVVTMAVHGSLLATIDKAHCINIMDTATSSFLCNDLHLNDFQKVPADLGGLRLFEMEYPYFSVLDESFYAFTCDFGTVMINYRP